MEITEARFSVHGKDLDEIEEQIESFLEDLVGGREEYPVFDVEYSVIPISLTSTGNVLVWEAQVVASV